MKNGRLILVVGPSGAGKDTVLAYARAHLAQYPQCVFPRRVITRPAGPGEDYESISEAAFKQRSFALSWTAHGLHYGIPIEIEAALADGKTVIANVSRAVIAHARATYNCQVIEITAPIEVLAKRLAQRGRETEADIARRLARSDTQVNADATIINDTTPEAAGAMFLAKLS